MVSHCNLSRTISTGCFASSTPVHRHRTGCTLHAHYQSPRYLGSVRSLSSPPQVSHSMLRTRKCSHSPASARASQTDKPVSSKDSQNQPPEDVYVVVRECLLVNFATCLNALVITCCMFCTSGKCPGSNGHWCCQQSPVQDGFSANGELRFRSVTISNIWLPPGLLWHPGCQIQVGKCTRCLHVAH